VLRQAEWLCAAAAGGKRESAMTERSPPSAAAASLEAAWGGWSVECEQPLHSAAVAWEGRAVDQRPVSRQHGEGSEATAVCLPGRQLHVLRQMPMGGGWPLRRQAMRTALTLPLSSPQAMTLTTPL